MISLNYAENTLYDLAFVIMAYVLACRRESLLSTKTFHGPGNGQVIIKGSDPDIYKFYDLKHIAVILSKTVMRDK